MTSISLGRLLGIEVKIDVSWLFIALFFGWAFYLQYDFAFEDLEPPANVLLSFASVVVFFASVLLHELSHSIVARRLGIPVEGITLFLFGGVTETRMEASSPRDEFLVAVVGPLMSIGIAAAFWVVVQVLRDRVADPIVYGVSYLAWLNLSLGIFNLAPGLPLDGGRVLRAFLWKTSGSVTAATRRAATAGKFLASLLVGGGILIVFAGDLSGLWLAAIGWFLFQAASATEHDVVIRQLLKRVKARQLMSPELVAIPPNTSIREAVDDYFLRYDHSAFPVLSEDRPGLLTLKAVREIPREQWERLEVWSKAAGMDEICTVDPDTTMDVVLERLREEGRERALVVEDGQILGIITPRDITRWVRRTQELGLAGPRT